MTLSKNKYTEVSPLRSQIARKVHHRVWEKQPAKTDHSKLANFVGEI